MKSKRNKMILSVIGLIFGFIAGYLGISGLKNAGISGEQSENLLIIIGISLCAAAYIQIIVHEVGHLIGGKASGYEFVSFRIANFMWIKDGEKLRFKKHMVAGTGGQCLMMPPNGNPYEYPYLLYNFGGALSNLVVSGICLILYFLFPDVMGLKTFLMMMCVIGVFFAVVNGVPMQVGDISNDGFNARQMKKSKNARYAFWVQLYINNLLTQGMYLKEISSEYFEMPPDADLKDPLICTIGALKCNYLHSQKRFKEAKYLTLDLFENAPGLLEIYKNELRCELLFYEIMGECRQEEVDKLYTGALKQYILRTSSYVSRRRLLYAYEMIITQDQGAAERQYQAFEKAASDYPYAGEIEDERKLIEFVKNKVLNKPMEEILNF